jgi:acyl-CoA synthetase (AMP-forming)/AMP-acid ligase II
MLTNVALHLARLAAIEPQRLAVAVPQGCDRAGRVAYTHYTFAQLHAESDRLARGLALVGIGRGVRTVLMVPPSLDFFALTFALFKVGAVPILIDPGMGVRRLGPCLAQAAPTAFVGISRAQLARWLFGWGRATLRTTVSVDTPKWGATYTLADVRRRGRGTLDPQVPSAEDELAAILFTSGSTGPAKGVEYTHGCFATQVEALRQLYAIPPGEVDLATFPLFALFGPALGMTAIVPRMDPTRPARVDPRAIAQAIADWGVTNLFGSPALLDRVGRYGAERGWRFPTLRRVISAGAPVPARVIERFTQLLPAGVQVFTPYGATEALPVASIGSTEILHETRHATARGCGVCVGRPVPGLRACILPISTGPLHELPPALPTGAIGEIAVQAPWVTARYYERPDATALAKVPAGTQFWHRMGDLGYRDAAGRLWFCGRKAQRVETAAGVLFTIPCEAIFNTHPAVYRSALVGVCRAGVTYPVICIELEPTQRPSVQLRTQLLALAAQHAHTRALRTLLFHPSFPVDIRHNAKIFRERLAEWATRQLRWTRLPAVTGVALPPTVAAVNA